MVVHSILEEITSISNVMKEGNFVTPSSISESCLTRCDTKSGDSVINSLSSGNVWGFRLEDGTGVCSFNASSGEIIFLIGPSGVDNEE